MLRENILLIIMKLQNSRTDLINNDMAAAKLLINESIEELKLYSINLENVGLEANDATTSRGSEDLINAILSISL